MSWISVLNKNQVANTRNESCNSLERLDETTINNENAQYELTIPPSTLLLTGLNRVCIYSSAIIYKVRILISILFVKIFNAGRRLRSFVRRTSSIRSTSSLSLLPVSTSTTNHIFEDDINSSSTLINYNHQFNLPSVENSAMAHVLIEQPTSKQDATLLPMSDSMDGKLFFCDPDSTSLLHFLQTVVSEPPISICHSTSNRFRKDNCTIINLFKKSQTDELVNCDTIQSEKETVLNNDSDNALKTINVKDLSEDSIENENVTSESMEELDENNNEDEKSNVKLNSSNRFRRKRLKNRLPDAAPTASEPIPENSSQCVLPSETSSIDRSTTQSSSSSTGSLKCTERNRRAKKAVRFADSVGGVLVQIQYIHSMPDEDSKEYSFLKNKLYLPKSSNIEHKPWSFDVALTSRQMPDIRIPKRFYCLYRQPNSEHPDIYLHDIWKSQIKLEYADVRSKSPISDRQYLYGTLWVTNINYCKRVIVKYTFNQWLNSYECEGRHRFHVNDFRNLDQFEFDIDIPQDVDRIDFVLCYCVNNQEYWDNNNGQNYTLQTESACMPQTTISLPHDCDFNEMRFY